MNRAVLLMAYGTPERADDVEAYFTHIRGGRAPSPEALARLQARYAAVGGKTPLLEISSRVRVALELELGHGRVYLGMKHWHPFIGDVVPRIAEEGASEIVAVALAPHYSRISIGGYHRAIAEAVTSLASPITVRMVDHWHLNLSFLDLLSSRVREAMAQWPVSRRAQVVTVFSAHSLPSRIREWNDPYEQQLLESCHAVAERAGVDHWRFSWQSAGETGEPWLGPDISETITELHACGVRDVLSVPIGFVSDHLEVLYDIDVEARRVAEDRGMTLRRIRMPNDGAELVRTLASVVEQAC